MLLMLNVNVRHTITGIHWILARKELGDKHDNKHMRFNGEMENFERIYFLNRENLVASIFEINNRVVNNK